MSVYKDATVPNEIFRQLGGSRALRMIGGELSAIEVDDQTLAVRFKARAHQRINFFRIRLEANDTYTVRFCRLWHRRGALHINHLDLVTETELVYAEDLVQLIEHTTGLYLSIGGRILINAQ